jgi:hypothetical protein
MLYLGQINSLGRVAFVATPWVPLFNPGTIYTAGDQPPTAAMAPSSSITFLGYNVASINDSGVIAFDALVDGVTPSILLLDTGKVRTVASAPVTAPGSLRSVRNTNINNSGVVAFHGTGNPGQPRTGIYTGADL